MTKVTRWGFLKKTSAGAAALGALGALPGVALAAGRPKTAAARVAEATAAEPFVVYVRNPAAGEISLLVGTEEVRYVDHELVARLWRARGARPGTSDRTGHSTGR